jgi:hydroxypyruvate isomerase
MKEQYLKNKHSRREFLKTGAAGAVLAGIPGYAKAAQKKPAGEEGQPLKTKFAINIEIWWKDLDLAQRIEKTAEFGFPAIEFWSYDDKDLEAMRKACDKTDLVITQFTAWGFKPGMNNPENHNQVEAKIKEACKVAKKLKCKMATVVGGDDQTGMTQDQMHENIIKALKRVAPIAEDNDLTLILEPMNIRVDHKGHCLYGSAPAIRICREVASSHVKINWDLYHMHITEGDLCGHLREGYDQIGYVQLADHPGRHEPGTGEIHYNRVLKELHDLGYKGYVGLECWPLEGEEKAAERVFLADRW